jgi:hypothetical protein
VIDLSYLVNARTFQARGLDVGDVTVYYDPAIPGAYADSQRMEIIIGDDLLLQASLHPEDFYLLAAHEITHFKQPPTHLEVEKTFITAGGRPTKIHARDEYEQEAIWWEAQQAARFGWDRDDYQAFVRRTRESGLSYLGATASGYDRRMEIELRERPYAAIPALSRRPNHPERGDPTQRSELSSHEVHVRRHWRSA